MFELNKGLMYELIQTVELMTNFLACACCWRFLSWVFFFQIFLLLFFSLMLPFMGSTTNFSQFESSISNLHLRKVEINLLHSCDLPLKINKISIFSFLQDYCFLPPLRLMWWCLASHLICEVCEVWSLHFSLFYFPVF